MLRHVALCFAAALSSVEGAAHVAKTCKTPEDVALLDMPSTVLNVPCYVTAKTHCDIYPVCCVSPGVCEYHGGSLSTNQAYYEGGCSPVVVKYGETTPGAPGCNGHQGECLIEVVAAKGGIVKYGNQTTPDAETQARIESDEAKLQPCITWDVVEFAFEFHTLLSEFAGHHNTAGDKCEEAVSEASGVHSSRISKVITPPPPRRRLGDGRRLGGHVAPAPDPDAPPEEKQKVTLHFVIEGFGTTAAAITTGMDAAFGDTATAQATLLAKGFDTTVTGVTGVISCPIVGGVAECANTLPGDGGLSTGALVAIIAGGVVAALLVLMFVKLVLFKKPANDGAAYGGKGGAA